MEGAHTRRIAVYRSHFASLPVSETQGMQNQVSNIISQPDVLPLNMQTLAATFSCRLRYLKGSPNQYVQDCRIPVYNTITLSLLHDHIEYVVSRSGLCGCKWYHLRTSGGFQDIIRKAIRDHLRCKLSSSSSHIFPPI